MPVRENPDAQERIAANREKMAGTAAHYLNQKGQEKTLKAGLDKTNKQIKDLFDECGPQDNGKHRELHVLLPDGKTSVLVQMQGRETVSLRSDALDHLRMKLGKDAEQWIESVEQVRPNALELLLMRGLIDATDMQAMTSTKRVESLVVQVDK